MTNMSFYGAIHHKRSNTYIRVILLTSRREKDIIIEFLNFFNTSKTFLIYIFIEKNVIDIFFLTNYFFYLLTYCFFVYSINLFLSDFWSFRKSFSRTKPIEGSR